jgi:IclR family acetate operon transcriptional repressor
LPDLVTATGLPKSSLHRYLEVLIQEAFVERDAQTGRCRLGAQIVSIAINETPLLVLRARPYLERLRDRFDETANLGILDGDHILYLNILESPRAIRLAGRVGDRDPVHSTALGKAIAAALPEDEVQSLLQRTGLPRLTANTITRAADFAKHLELVRRHGFAVDDQENDIDGRCVAVAIPAERVKYAISVSGISSRFPMSKTAEVARAIREVASELSQQSISPIKPYT